MCKECMVINLKLLVKMFVNIFYLGVWTVVLNLSNYVPFVNKIANINGGGVYDIALNLGFTVVLWSLILGFGIILFLNYISYKKYIKYEENLNLKSKSGNKPRRCGALNPFC